MSLRGVKKVVTELTAGLKIYKFTGGVKPNCARTILDVPISKDISLLNQQLNTLSLCKNQTEKFNLTNPILDTEVKKNIIEPTNNAKIDFELPIRHSNNTALDLPLHIKKEIAEPGKVISKKAMHLIIIRRRKMKKHKRTKYYRKHRIEIAKKKLQRALEKENNLQSSLRVILNEKDTFSAEKFVSEMLEKAHWVRPITKARGRLAPQWVIKNELQRAEEKRILKERIEECLK